MVLEAELFPAVERHYRKEGYDVEKEVPMRYKVIDIVCRNDNEIIAIEVKVQNWKKALEQAIIYQLCANRTYVALYHKFSTRAKKIFFHRYGVGFIEVNQTIDIKMESKRDVALNPFYQEAIIEYLEKRRVNNENLL
ncbi:MAG: hypothetical protein PVF58_15630 [Candidatus Methanofastidiosia archaeon]|jgi:hypothetical protein